VSAETGFGISCGVPGYGVPLGVHCAGTVIGVVVMMLHRSLIPLDGVAVQATSSLNSARNWYTSLRIHQGVEYTIGRRGKHTDKTHPPSHKTKYWTTRTGPAVEFLPIKFSPSIFKIVKTGGTGGMLPRVFSSGATQSLTPPHSVLSP